MDPFTIGLVVSGIVSLGSAALGAVGSASQREADGKSVDFNTRELKRSAQLEDANAVDALARGAQAAGRVRLQGSQLQARQALGYAASGVDTTVGTPAQVAESTGVMTELDALTLQNNAMREAWGHKEVGRKYRAQARQLQDAYANGATAQQLQGIGMGLQTAGTLAGLAAKGVGRGGGL